MSFEETADRTYRDKDWLNKRLVDEKQSIYDVALECGVTKQTIKRWAKKLQIDRGTILERWLRGVGLGTECPSCGKTIPNGKYCCFCGVQLI